MDKNNDRRERNSEEQFDVDKEQVESLSRNSSYHENDESMTNGLLLNNMNTSNYNDGGEISIGYNITSVELSDDNHHVHDEDDINAVVVDHPSYSFRPIDSHESYLDNNHGANDNNLLVSSGRFETASVDDNCHYYRDEREYDNRTPQQNNHQINIQTRDFVRSLDNQISPSSSLIADDDTSEVCDDDVMNVLHNTSSLENIPEAAEVKDQSLDGFITRDENHDTISSHSSIIPSPAPPPPSEQTAREQLIERERQGRLERERARLKQQLALSRERYEEDEAYADIDRMRQRVESIDNNSLDVMDLTDAEDEGNNEGGHNHNQSSDIILPDYDPHSNQLGANSITEFVRGLTPASEVDIRENNDVFDDNMRVRSRSRGNSSSADRSTPTGNISPSPLGFTMERFLQDRVIVQSTVAPSIHLNGDEVETRDTSTLQSIRSEPDNGHNEVDDQSIDNDSNTNHQLVDLLSETSNTSEVVDISMRTGAINSLDLVSHTLPLVSGVNVRRSEGNRLERLTEAEILDLAEIDYASVGNMPPRSERDEQHLPDLSGMGGMSNLSDQTCTTMLESISMASVDADASRSEACSHSSTHLQSIHGLANTNSPVAIAASDLLPTFQDVGSTKPINEVLQSDMIEPSIDDHDKDSPLKSPPELETLQKEPIKDNVTDNNLKPPALVIETGFEEIDHNEVRDDHQGNDEVFNFPNRVIRPGIINPPNQPPTPLHRRSQTTPISLSNFVDDFDFNKYTEGPYHRNGDVNTLDDFLISIDPNQASFRDYGSTSLQNNSFDQEQQYVLNDPKDEENDEEHHPLFAKKTHRRESIDEIMDSVFSSVRSLSTDDIEADIKDCDKYLASKVLDRGKSGQFDYNSLF